MINITRFIVLLAIIITCTNCSTDFELNSEWKEVAVVYGLLDQTEERQYIRLSKAFLSEENAIEVAQIADSLYFKNASVVINEYDARLVFQRDRYVFDGSQRFIKTIEFQRIEASTDESVPQKEEGIFANNPYFLYYTEEKLNENMVYELVVTTDLGNEVRALTPLVKDFGVITPRSQLDEEEPPTELSLPNDNINVRFKYIGAENKRDLIYDLYIEFKYREALNSDRENDEVKTVNYTAFKNKAADNFQGNSTLAHSISTDNLLTFLAREVGVENSSAYYRTLFNPTFKFSFFAGSRTLKEFSEVANVSENSVNAGSAKPIYTNIENGIGLFGSRFKKDVFANIKANSLDVFFCGDITKDLNFDDEFNQVTCDD